MLSRNIVLKICSLFFIPFVHHLIAKGPSFDSGLLEVSPSPSVELEASLTCEPCNSQCKGEKRESGKAPLSSVLSWKLVTKEGPKPPRDSAAMIFDECSCRMILFGGLDPKDEPLGDTWAFSDKQWTKLTPDDSRGVYPRGHASIAFDSCKGEIIMVGGSEGKPGSRLWDSTDGFIGNKWIFIIPKPDIPPRSLAAIAFDPGIERVILFGGRIDSNGKIASDETWAFENRPSDNKYKGAWNNLNPSNHPSYRTEAAMAFDPRNQKILLFGGWEAGDSSGKNLKNDTWVFDAQMNTWEELKPSNAPKNLLEVVMAFDSTHDQMILFGTNMSSKKSETWKWEFDSSTWTQLNFGEGASTPSGRVYPSMAFDLSSNEMILFGGYDKSNGKVLNDTWALGVHSPIEEERDPLPPMNVKAFQQANAFATQIDHVNVLTWNPPSQGNPPMGYRIYRDQSLTKWIGEVSGEAKLSFKDHNREKGRTYTYYIVSVDQRGIMSAPAIIKVEGTSR